MWAPKETPVVVEQTSGRQRRNIHGAIDLETGQTRMLDVVTVDAVSTIQLMIRVNGDVSAQARDPFCSWTTSATITRSWCRSGSSGRVRIKLLGITKHHAAIRGADSRSAPRAVPHRAFIPWLLALAGSQPRIRITDITLRRAYVTS